MPTFRAYAQEFSSSSYRVIDPVIKPSGYATSSSFQLWSTLGEVAIGTSSTSSYQVGAGFLRFPSVSSFTASSTLAGDGYINMAWTTATGYLGWAVTSYSVGRSTVLGGPYTYFAAGSGNTHSMTGLTNGVPYYFVITPNDFFGIGIATSTEFTATPVAPSLTFNLTSNVAYFGALSAAAPIYASSTDTNGSTDEVEAHTLQVKTNAANGYLVTVQGESLKSQQNPNNIITPIGAANTAPAPGTKQFGLRMTASGGTGTVEAIYAGSGFAYGASATTSSSVALNTIGDNATTTYSVRYVANREGLTEAGTYSTSLIYLATANF